MNSTNPMPLGISETNSHSGSRVTDQRYLMRPALELSAIGAHDLREARRALFLAQRQRPFPRGLVVVQSSQIALERHLLVGEALAPEAGPDVVEEQEEDAMFIQVRRPDGKLRDEPVTMFVHQRGQLHVGWVAGSQVHRTIVAAGAARSLEDHGVDVLLEVRQSSAAFQRVDDLRAVVNP